MALKIHFETLALGMQAKLSTRYRLLNNHTYSSNSINILKALYPNSAKTGILGDAILTLHNRLR